MVKVGDRLDLGFEVKAVRQGERVDGSFGDLVDSLTVVSVYMKNNTGSCDKQVCSLVDGTNRILELGSKVIVVSKDTIGSHARYSAKQKALFTFVSDPGYEFARAVDSLVEKKMYGKVFIGPTRSAYLIDETCVVRGIVEKVDSANHLEQLEVLIRSIN